MDFNPRSPRGERHDLMFGILFCIEFQSTLPAGGATVKRAAHAFRLAQFQSTLPAGGATLPALRLVCDFLISIHAPRGGSDDPRCQRPPRPPDFNPRSPRGERPGIVFRRFPAGRFQSTLPAGGATRLKPHFWVTEEFQSTLPAGGATIHAASDRPARRISIHAPRGGSDRSSGSSPRP